MLLFHLEAYSVQRPRLTIVKVHFLCHHLTGDFHGLFLLCLGRRHFDGELAIGCTGVHALFLNRARIWLRMIMATRFKRKVRASRTNTVEYKIGLVASTSGDCVESTNI